MTDLFTVWIIYDHPDEYPYSYVAKRFSGNMKSTYDIYINHDLENLFSIVQTMSDYPLTRRVSCSDCKHSRIIESWI
jgi:hypothetical protein